MHSATAALHRRAALLEDIARAYPATESARADLARRRAAAIRAQAAQAEAAIEHLRADVDALAARLAAAGITRAQILAALDEPAAASAPDPEHP